MASTFSTITANLHAPASFTTAEVEAAVLSGLHVRSLHEDVSVREVPGVPGTYAVRIRYPRAAGTAEVRDVAARLSRTPNLTANVVRIDGRPVPAAFPKCGRSVSDGNADDPSYAYCGHPRGHAGDCGAWEV